MVVKEGDTVKVEFTGRLEDGTVFDTSQDSGPLEFTVGAGKIIPGFENAVKGMRLNEEKTVTIKPKDGFGNRSEDLIMPFPKSQLPRNFEPKKGTRIVLEDSSGRTIPAIIVDVTEDNVIIDLNHPLAGQTLIFDIKVVDIK